MFVSFNNIINLYIYILYIYIFTYDINDTKLMKSMTCPFSLQEWGSSQYVAMFSWGKICVWLGLNHRFQVFFVNSMWTHVFCHFHPKEIVDQSVRKGDQVLMPGISWHIVPAAVAYNIWFIWSSVSCFTSLCERRSDTIRYDQIRSDTMNLCRFLWRVQNAPRSPVTFSFLW